MIGIIGGNGVAATNRLLDLIEKKMVSRGAFRDVHHPEIIAWQATKVPSRSMYLEGLGDSFLPGYIEIGRKLKDCGCTSLCMCCNTAYYAVNELQEQIGLPFINILSEVTKECNRLGVQRIGIMCSNGLRRIGLYNDYFMKENAAIKVVYPDDELQQVVTLGICNSKNLKRVDPLGEEYPQRLFSRVCDWFISQKCDCIVAGCTDISAVFCPDSWRGVCYVDSLQVLSERLLDEYNYSGI